MSCVCSARALAGWKYSPVPGSPCHQGMVVAPRALQGHASDLARPIPKWKKPASPLVCDLCPNQPGSWAEPLPAWALCVIHIWALQKAAAPLCALWQLLCPSAPQALPDLHAEERGVWVFLQTPLNAELPAAAAPPAAACHLPCPTGPWRQDGDSLGWPSCPSQGPAGDGPGWLSASGRGAVAGVLEALQDKGFSLLPVSANSYCN